MDLVEDRRPGGLAGVLGGSFNGEKPTSPGWSSPDKVSTQYTRFSGITLEPRIEEMPLKVLKRHEVVTSDGPRVSRNTRNFGVLSLIATGFRFPDLSRHPRGTISRRASEIVWRKQMFTVRPNRSFGSETASSTASAGPTMFSVSFVIWAS
jgi:hypothetical protein